MTELLATHRDRLKRMVAARLDPRLAPRVDPSDVVQEALADASRKLPDYLRDQPLPFYPWLRQIALNRLSNLGDRHLRAQKRSVAREETEVLNLPDQSAMILARRLLAHGTSPSARLSRRELRAQVRAALDDLDVQDREVLVMRHLEQLPMAEIAAILGLSTGAARMRHLRAIRRFRDLLGDDFREELS